MDNVRDVLCVQFPGIVQNVEKMLKMIGGVDKLLKTYKSQQDRLELRFRPDDDFCRGVYGDKVVIDQVVVKVVKKTIKYSDGSKDVTFSTQVIGICRCCYVYTSLMEFQYLPMERVEISNNDVRPSKRKKMKKSPAKTDDVPQKFCYKSIANQAIPNDPFDASTNYELNETAPLMILPAIFCRFDRPSTNYDYKDHDHRVGKMKELSEQLDSRAVIAKTRKSRALNGHVLYWKDEVPHEPKPEALEMLKSAFVNQDTIDRVKDHFETRPVWSKAALKYHSKCSDRELKSILPTIAYNLTDGPYRCMWVKLGYDVKKHPESAPYQSIDFRIKHHFAHRLDRAQDNEDIVQSKRSVYQYQLPLMKAAPQGKRRFKVIKTEPETQDDDSLRSVFIFKEGLIPMNRICIYQLIDIDLAMVQELISQKIPENVTCSEKDGWYPTGSIEKVRQAMNKVLDKMLGDKGKVSNEDDDESNDVNLSEMMADEDSDEDDDDDDPEYNPKGDK